MALGDYAKTTWVNGGPPGISAGRLNNIENKTEELDTGLKNHGEAATLDHPDDSVTDAKIGNRTITDASSPTGDSGTLTNLFSWLGNMIKSITGKSSWRTAPSKSLEDFNTHLAEDATAATKGHVQIGTGLSVVDGVVNHQSTPGNKHIPSGGSTGQILIYSADGTAKWGSAGARYQKGVWSDTTSIVPGSSTVTKTIPLPFAPLKVNMNIYSNVDFGSPDSSPTGAIATVTDSGDKLIMYKASSTGSISILNHAPFNFLIGWSEGAGTTVLSLTDIRLNGMNLELDFTTASSFTSHINIKVIWEVLG